MAPAARLCLDDAPSMVQLLKLCQRLRHRTCFLAAVELIQSVNKVLNVSKSHTQRACLFHWIDEEMIARQCCGIKLHAH